MEFSTTDVIEFPIEKVFSTHRDHLSELVEYLPSVETIVVESREAEADVVRFVNIWTAARTEVPRIVRPFIKAHMLKWIDKAAWHDDKKVCDWEIELGFLKDAIRVSGQNRMEPAGDDKTKVTIAGRIDVDGAKIPGVPKFMSKKVSGAVESFVVKMITPNLKKTNEGVGAYLKDQDGEAGADS